MPFSEQQLISLTLYAATKKRQRLDGPQLLVAYTACRRPGFASSPSMAPGAGPTWRCSCSPNILAGAPIDVFNDGRHQRDFTYIDDIVRAYLGALDHARQPIPLESGAPVRARATRRIESTTSAISGP